MDSKDTLEEIPCAADSKLLEYVQIASQWLVYEYKLSGHHRHASASVDIGFTNE